MRKIFLPMVIVLVLMASLSMKSLAQRGDVNEDGMVNITDVTTLIDYLLTNQWEAGVTGTTGDVNDDELVNIVDVTVLIDYLLSRTWTGICKTVTVGDVSFKMIYVDGGTFMMGSEDTTLTNFHYPPHEVTLSGFYMGQTEVTQALWYAVMGSNPSYHKGADFPVEYITWEEQLQFVDRLNAMTGMSFRIPTEAEWEFAARGGNLSQSYKYSGSNDIDEVAWYCDNSYALGSSSPDYGTHAVATKAPNELGLYDMSGNVWEWVQDWWSYYSSDAQTNPAGPTTGSYRVVCGGSWRIDSKYCRVSYRNADGPSGSVNDLGLRLAL